MSLFNRSFNSQHSVCPVLFALCNNKSKMLTEAVSLFLGPKLKPRHGKNSAGRGRILWARNKFYHLTLLKKKWEGVFVTKPVLTDTFPCNMSLPHGNFSQDKSQNFWSWHQGLPLLPLIIVFTITFMYHTALPDFFPCSAPHTFLGKFWWKRSPGLRNLNYSGFWFCPLCYVFCEAISNHFSSKAISGLTTIIYDPYQSNNI